MNRPILITEIELITNNLLKQKQSGADCSTGEFHKTFEEDLMPILILS